MHNLGWTFGIPDTAMAMTFIAAGTSVPDALTSFIVVRDGERTMQRDGGERVHIDIEILIVLEGWTLRNIGF